MNEIKEKSVEVSRTEVSHLLCNRDMNGAGRLFGGQLLMWIDEVAGIVAKRHCECNVTTASIDNLQFKEACYLGDVIVLIGYLTHVGNSSMEVRIDTYVEKKNGKRYRHRSGGRGGRRNQGSLACDSQGRAHHGAAPGDFLHRLDSGDGGLDPLASGRRGYEPVRAGVPVNRYAVRRRHHELRGVDGRAFRRELRPVRVFAHGVVAGQGAADSRTFC